VTYTSISFNGTFVLATRSDGEAVGWGDNYFSQCEIPERPDGTSWSRVFGGADHAAGMLDTGEVIMWGTNFEGESDVAFLPAGQVLDMALGSGFTIALVKSPCVPDLNFDHIVDSADMGTMLLDFGPCNPGSPADLNGDLNVDSADMGIMLLNFGPCP
jgi:hypothetical protein